MHEIINEWTVTNRLTLRDPTQWIHDVELVIASTHNQAKNYHIRKIQQKIEKENEKLFVPIPKNNKQKKSIYLIEINVFRLPSNQLSILSFYFLFPTLIFRKAKREKQKSRFTIVYLTLNYRTFCFISN